MQRSRKVRVKSGCRTCKTRRVKCDERRPACVKCTQSNRVCEGYGIWGGGSTEGPTHPTDSTSHFRLQASRQCNAPFILVDKLPEERKGFEYFCQAKSLKISGVFKSDFWDRVVVQASVAEPVVFHALVAVASAHRVQMLRATSRVCTQLYERISVSQYNKAIKSLGQVLDKGDAPSLRVAAMTCALFVCLEMLQARQSMMNAHLRYGLVLLTKLKALGGDGNAYIISTFRKLMTHLSILGHSAQLFPFDSACDVADTYSFSCTDDAVRSLETLTAMVFDLKASTVRLSPTQPVPPPLIKRQSVLRHRLSAWRHAYHASMKTNFVTSSLVELLGLRCLLNHHLMAEIMAGTCLSRQEVTYDAFIPTFRSIVTQNEAISKVLIGYYASEATRMCDPCGSFTIEQGGFPPLYFTAMKCRDADLRRRAIGMLLKVPHVEGMANGPILSKIANTVFALEDPLGFQGTEERTGPIADLVPEESRFCRIDVHMADGLANIECGRYKLDQDPFWEVSHHQVLFDAPVSPISS